MVLGVFPNADTPLYGLVVRDGTGRDRAWLVADEGLVELGFDHNGNNVLTLGVDEWGSPYVHFDDDAGIEDDTGPGRG